jgi:hypothetical protein
MKTMKTEKNAIDRAKRLLAVYNATIRYSESWHEGYTAFIFIPYVGGYHIKKENNMFSLMFER